MLVSVIMPCYNSMTTVRESVQSILDQTYNNLELIIVDDNSTDDTVSILKDIANEDVRIKLVLLDTNFGAGFARNAALNIASGEAVAFCDADDIWVPCKLEVQLPLLEKYDVICSSYDIVSKERRIGKEYVSGEIRKFRMILNNYIGMSTAIFLRKEGFNYRFSLMRRRQDWDFWLNLMENGHSVFAHNDSLVFIRKGNNGLSSKKWILVKANYRFYRRRYNIWKSVSLLVLFLFIYILRSINRYL